MIHLFCGEAEGNDRVREGVEVQEVEERPIFSTPAAGALWMDLQIVVTSLWI